MDNKGGSKRQYDRGSRGGNKMREGEREDHQGRSRDTRGNENMFREGEYEGKDKEEREGGGCNNKGGERGGHDNGKMKKESDNDGNIKLTLLCFSFRFLFFAVLSAPQFTGVLATL